MFRQFLNLEADANAYRRNGFMSKQDRLPHGFTLVELLVVIAVIAILTAMLIPAIGASRAVARQRQCEHNVTQLAFALGEFETAQGSLPMGVNDPGDAIRSENQGLHQSWIVALLPFMDQMVVRDKIDLGLSVYAPENATAREFSIPRLRCPDTDRLGDGIGHSDYAGVHNEVEKSIGLDDHGLLFLRSAIRTSEIPDGQGYTLLIGEKLTQLGDLGWMSGTRATLRNTGSPLNQIEDAPPTDPMFVGGFGSNHSSGINMAFADGAVRYMGLDVDLSVLQQLAHRSDGSLPKLPE